MKRRKNKRQDMKNNLPASLDKLTNLLELFKNIQVNGQQLWIRYCGITRMKKIQAMVQGHGQGLIHKKMLEGIYYIKLLPTFKKMIK